MSKRALWVFMMMNFVLNMLATVFAGILDRLAVALGITEAQAGLLNGLFAYGAAVGVPLALLLFRRAERTRMLKVMLALTIVTTVLLVLVTNFYGLLIIRFVMGLASNAYSVLATTTAVNLVDESHRGRAVAFLITGNSLALVIGIPLSRALTGYFRWEIIFYALTAMMVVSLIYFLRALKPAETDAPPLDIRQELHFLKQSRVLELLAFTLIMFTASGAFHTYITPYLLTLFPSLEPRMSGVLLALGIASFVGNAAGGRVSDRQGFSRAMLIGSVAQLLSMAAIALAMRRAWLTVILAVIWMFFQWFNGLQPHAGCMALTGNASTFVYSLVTSLMHLGGAIGSSIAAASMTATHVRNNVFIALACYLVIVVMHGVTEYRRSPGW